MDNALHILHVIGGGEFGGAEQHIISLMDHYQDHAINATVITFYDSIFAQKLREAGHSVIPIERFGRFDLRILTALIRIFNKLNPDIVHTHGVRANFFARLAAKRSQNKKVITTVHSMLRHDYPKTIPYIIASLMERFTQTIPSHYIAVSDAIKQQLISNKIDENKITLIQNGINAMNYARTPTISAQAITLRQAWNIHADAFVIGTIARLVPVKGLHDMIAGMAIALKQDASLHLLIVGDGPEKERLQQLITEYQIDHHVSMVGFRTDVAACLSAMDAYINCSLSEGTPISVMEAMAAEKPLILTAVGGMVEMAQDEVSALMIPAKSPESIATSILRLKNESTLREQLATTARKTVEERYTVEAMTRQQINIYNEVVEGKSRAWQKHF